MLAERGGLGTAIDILHREARRAIRSPSPSAVATGRMLFQAAVLLGGRYAALKRAYLQRLPINESARAAKGE